MRILAIILLLPLVLSCHYSCATCSTEDYYMCLSCNPGRGNNLQPVYGMCYCSAFYDQNLLGVCDSTGTYNATNKILMTVFIGLSLGLSALAMLLKTGRYFLFKVIEDVQELSLIVFINLYFPQQFDMLLMHLYNFNISSYTFEVLSLGSLFSEQSGAILDGENMYGKYKLLHKTANFFSNQFTWMLAALGLALFGIAIKVTREWLKSQRENRMIRRELKTMESRQDESLASMHEVKITTLTKKRVEKEECGRYCFFNTLNNILWFNFFISFFYFSLIEININMFTQISNLTFSSRLASAGAFFSAIFMALQIVVASLLLIKTKEEMIKPEWMRDYSFASAMHLVRTNYKTITKYFFFFSCIKKVALAAAVTVFYADPLTSIVTVATVHGVYLALAIYCEPFERRYIRIHFYLTEGLKMFVYLSLIDFASQYTAYVQLISITQIFFSMLTFIFGLHFICIVLHLVAERHVYLHFLRKKISKKYKEKEKEVRLGYRADDRLYLYEKE